LTKVMAILINRS